MFKTGLEFWSFGYSDLFRISIFDIRIYLSPKAQIGFFKRTTMKVNAFKMLKR